MLHQFMYLGRRMIRLTGLVENLKLPGIANGCFHFIAYGLENVPRPFIISRNAILYVQGFNDQGAIGITACRTERLGRIGKVQEKPDFEAGHRSDGTQSRAPC